MVVSPKNLVDLMALTPSDLPDFWEKTLTVERIRFELASNKIVLAALPVGGGKSTFADKLITDKGIYEAYDRVIYFASTTKIIKERAPFVNRDVVPVKWAYLEPRPRDICGSFDEEWQLLEKLGCSDLAKEKLCKVCPNNTQRKPCSWLISLPKKIKGVELVLCTDQRLLIDPILIRKMTPKSQSILSIFDEALFLNSTQRSYISFKDLAQFSQALDSLSDSKSSTLDKYMFFIQSLQNYSPNLSVSYTPYLPSLGEKAIKIQKIGFARYGREFRYIGYDLEQLSRSQIKWRDGYDNIIFIKRPYLSDSTLILAAHAHPEYLIHRIGDVEISTPFSGLRMEHPDTRIYNIKDRRGMMMYFYKNKVQVLDFISILIKRNIESDRSTILVSKKTLKQTCANYITSRLASWGIAVQILINPPYPEKPVSTIVPIIHYGTIGENTFSAYESCYCINGYYIKSGDLQNDLQETIPDQLHHKLNIVCDSHKNRRVSFESPQLVSSEYHQLANIYLRQKEIDPVLQAVGRVRFLTKPREVIFFQVNDLYPDIGDSLVEFDSITTARKYFKLPSSKDIDHSIILQRLYQAREDGMSLRQAAKDLGISKSTAWRLLNMTGSKKSLDSQE